MSNAKTFAVGNYSTKTISPFRDSQCKKVTTQTMLLRKSLDLPQCFSSWSRKNLTENRDTFSAFSKIIALTEQDKENNRHSFSSIKQNHKDHHN